jgi:PKD repeat protein
MRSIHLMAATTVMLAAAWSCGGGSNVGPNTPVANFTAGACTAGTPCQFTNTSTPSTGLTSEWDFGDGSAKVSDPSPAHTFATPGDKSVSLKVTDASAATNTKTSTVTVAAGTNQPPVASFTVLGTCTAGTPCGFHSTSTDADGTIASSVWNFGDGSPTVDSPDATHTYAAPGQVTLTLTVTDDKGGTNTASQSITVSQQASQSCTTTGKRVDCSLAVTQKATVKITLVSHSCELPGNDLTIPALTPPQAAPPQTVFLNLCNRTDGESYTISQDGTATGPPQVLQAGTQLVIRFHQGTPGPNDPPAGDPGIRLQGSYPSWTLKVDDGGAFQNPGEPDFNDAILLVQATSAP